MKLEDLEEGKWYKQKTGASVVYGYVVEVRFSEMDIYAITFTASNTAYVEEHTVKRTQKRVEHEEGVDERFIVKKIFEVEKIFQRLS